MVCTQSVSEHMASLYEEYGVFCCNNKVCLSNQMRPAVVLESDVSNIGMRSHNGSTSNATTLRSRTGCSTGFALGGGYWKTVGKYPIKHIRDLGTTSYYPNGYDSSTSGSCVRCC